MPELAQSKPKIGFEVPEIMDWTILPASITAAAWTDPEVRALLLNDPTSLLRERISRCPRDKTFCVAVDSAEVKFFALPARKKHLGQHSRDALLEILARETENDDSLEHWLPSDVIADALTDEEFKTRLIQDPARVLKDRGHSPPPRQIIVLENSESTYHLVLTENPSRQDELDLKSLEENLIEKFGVETTKCCASGTCS